MNNKAHQIVDSEENKSFWDLNQQPFKELLTFVDFADDKLNIAFAEINFAQDRDLIIEKLIENPNCKNIQFEVLDFSDPDLRFMRDELVKALQEINITADKKLVLLVTGIEKSIGVLDEYPPILVDLNYVRDDLRKTVPHPIIFFLPEYALTRLAKYAPDFWAWSRQVFSFQSSIKSDINQTIDSPIFIKDHIINWTLTEKQERVSLLLRLLGEYCNRDYEAKHKSSLINIYNELSVAFNTLGDYQQAIIFCQNAISICQYTGDKKAEASSLNNLGNTYLTLGQYERAIECFQKSLEIQQNINDYNEKSHSLGGLGNSYYSLGKYEQAIDFHQQSLDISQKIEDINGEVQSINNLANIYHALGEYKQAIVLYQQSLNISIKIGNVYIEALSLGNLANSYHSLGKYKQAIDFHQQSLKIKQNIGNRRGEVDSFIGLGVSYNRLEDYQNAVEFYLQAQEIANKISYRDGEARAWFNLGNTWEMLQNKSEAISAFYNARKLCQEMGLDKMVENCAITIQELENNDSFS